MIVVPFIAQSLSLSVMLKGHKTPNYHHHFCWSGLPLRKEAVAQLRVLSL